MKVFQEQVLAEDGLLLNFYRWIPNNAKAAIVISHGWSEHVGRYDLIARWFASEGYEVHALDHRGHGQSAGARGHVDNWCDYAHDLEQLRQSIDQESQYLLGHSMGGMIGVVHMLEYPKSFRAAVLSGPAADVSIPVPKIKYFLGKTLSGIWPTLSLRNDIDPYSVCSKKEIVEDYIHDPLNHGRVSARWFSDYLDMIERVKAESPDITTPVAIWHGSEDVLVEPWVSEVLYDGFASNEKQRKVIHGGYHEILYEANWKDTAQDMKIWLEKF